MEAKIEQELRAMTINDTEIHVTMPNLQEVEVILGYKFNNQDLLEEAFTHNSYPEDRPSYERLEYLGDSVLNFLITKVQFFQYPGLSPGSLTQLRSANVSKEKLARVAVNHGFYRYVRPKAPPLEEKIQEFMHGMKEYPLQSNGLLNAPKVLSNVVESTIGAVFVDSNCSLETVWKVFKNLLEPIINPQTLGMHPVTELVELCQKKGWHIRFENGAWKESTKIDVFVEDHLVGSATYAFKKEIALNRAAKDALANVEKILGEQKEIALEQQKML